MNQSVSLEFDKMMVDSKDDMHDDIDNCRLLHRMNVNWQLFEVLQYLSVTDLLQVSKLAVHFHQIINNWIIAEKLFNLELTDPYDKCKVLRVSGENYMVILQTIIDRCSPNILTDIDIIVNSTLLLLNRNMVQSFASFTNLQNVRIDTNWHFQNIVDVLDQIAASAFNLKILQLRGYNIEGQWLRTTHMKNLTELSLDTLTYVSMDNLTYFIREHPKLELFSFSGLNDIVGIGECLAQNCHYLKQFLFKDVTNNSRHTEDDEDDDDDDDNNVDDKLAVSKNASNRYSFLSSFQQLNVFTFTSYVQFNYTFMSLATMYNLNEFKANINSRSYTNQYTFKHLIDSQTVEIDIQKYSNNMEEDAGNRSDSTLQYILDIASQMKNLQKITIVSQTMISNVEKIFELARNIHTLSKVKFLYLPANIWKIAHTLREIRKKRKYNDLPHMIDRS